MSVSVSMPQLGESVTEGTVTRWLKHEGDHVSADEPLLEVSTDKVDTEIPSPVSGILRGITVAEDETVAVGAELAVIDEDGAQGGTAGAQEPAQAAPPPAPQYQEQQHQEAYQQAEYQQTPYEQAPAQQYQQAQYEQAQYEQAPYEQAQHEQAPYEQTQYEQAPYQQAQDEQAQYGQAQHGQAQYEQAPYAQPATGYEAPPPYSRPGTAGRLSGVRRRARQLPGSASDPEPAPPAAAPAPPYPPAHAESAPPLPYAGPPARREARDNPAGAGGERTRDRRGS